MISSLQRTGAKARPFILKAVLCGAAGIYIAAAQVTPATILEVEVENIVAYNSDLFDASKFATDPNLTTIQTGPRNFGFTVAIGDIVAVNSKPAKGSLVFRGQSVILSPAPTAGQAVADIVRIAVSEYLFEIQQTDGTPVGNIHTLGMSGGVSAVGALPGGGNQPIVGGTGAFLGAKGQMSARPGAMPPIPPRNASMTEDPARRRVHGGGRVLFAFQLIPMTLPAVSLTTAGPAVFHGDFSPVTPARPASAGEVLILMATGLGPTRPSVNPGQPFPLDSLLEVNSPIEVHVGNREAEVVNKVGWPGAIDTFRVDFRVPAGTPAGLTRLRLTAAWVSGSEVQIPVR